MADTDLLQAWKHFSYVIQEKKNKTIENTVGASVMESIVPTNPGLAVALALPGDLGNGILPLLVLASHLQSMGSWTESSLRPIFHAVISESSIFLSLY